MVAGFYLVSHIEGDRDQFTHSGHHTLEPGKWRYSLKAFRAFKFLEEYRPHIDQFDPTVTHRAQAISKHAEALSEAQIQRLRQLPFMEVPIFGGPDFVPSTICVPSSSPHKVKGGPQNRSGYFIPGEPRDTVKELYVLSLKGDISAFLGRSANGLEIHKVGLSISPKARLESFQRTLPKGSFSWSLYRSTGQDGHTPYPSFDAAERGENAMKDHLGFGRPDRWLGGEFYLAAKTEMEAAWNAGRNAALTYVPAYLD